MLMQSAYCVLCSTEMILRNEQVSFTIVSPPARGERAPRRSTVTMTVTAAIIPTPPRYGATVPMNPLILNLQSIIRLCSVANV